MPQKLLYSDYINVKTLRESLRIPEEVPEGKDEATWPSAKKANWKPGDSWPTGKNWSHEEVLFIRTHQAFEIWFSQIIHDLESVINEVVSVVTEKKGKIPKVKLANRLQNNSELMKNGYFYEAEAVISLSWFNEENLNRWIQRLKRSVMVLKNCLPFYDNLATMTPKQFLEFRFRLDPASGFGSSQFREVELMLGLRELHEPKFKPENGVESKELPKGCLKPTAKTPQRGKMLSFVTSLPLEEIHRLARRRDFYNFRDIVYSILNATEFEEIRKNYSERVVNFETKNIETIHASLILENPSINFQLFDFLQSCLELDEAILIWRQYHMSFVNKMIGARQGTGGGGIKYLNEILTPEKSKFMNQGFPTLWESRTVFM